MPVPESELSDLLNASASNRGAWRDVALRIHADAPYHTADNSSHMIIKQSKYFQKSCMIRKYTFYLLTNNIAPVMSTK